YSRSTSAWPGASSSAFAKTVCAVRKSPAAIAPPARWTNPRSCDDDFASRAWIFARSGAGGSNIRSLTPISMLRCVGPRSRRVIPVLQHRRENRQHWFEIFLVAHPAANPPAVDRLNHLGVTRGGDELLLAGTSVESQHSSRIFQSKMARDSLCLLQRMSHQVFVSRHEYR